MISRIRSIPKSIQIGLLLLAVVGMILGKCFMVLESVFGMTDDTGKTALSPDHRYRATLHYKDGLTFGFQHVVLETTSRHPFSIGICDIAEVDESGLFGVSWCDNRTLVVDYDATKHRDPMWDTEFVVHEKHWRDVRIEYHKSYELDEYGGQEAK